MTIAYRMGLFGVDGYLVCVKNSENEAVKMELCPTYTEYMNRVSSVGFKSLKLKRASCLKLAQSLTVSKPPYYVPSTVREVMRVEGAP